jgi:hypothetical protein
MVMSLQQQSTELSKKLISIVIIFIVQIFKNTSQKFVLLGFTLPVKSLIIVPFASLDAALLLLSFSDSLMLSPAILKLSECVFDAIVELWFNRVISRF